MVPKIPQAETQVYSLLGQLINFFFFISFLTNYKLRDIDINFFSPNCCLAGKFGAEQLLEEKELSLLQPNRKSHNISVTKNKCRSKKLFFFWASNPRS